MSGLEELLQQDDFIHWVLMPDMAGNQYWEAWMNQHPERADLLLKAKELVQFVHGSERQDAETLKEKNIAPQLWDRINEQIREEAASGRVIPFHAGHTPDSSQFVRSVQSPPSSLPVRKYFYRYLAAAAIIGLLILSSVWLYERKTGNGAAIAHQQAGLIVKPSGSTNLECINNGSSPQMVYLVDGTKIILEGKSKLYYEKFLQKEKREIRLEGEAFFEVAKDPSRPFYVHTRGLTTRVLGTSFRIIARKEDEKITVAVKTGRVTVSVEQADTKNKEYILQANQQVVFNKHLQTTAKAIVTDSSLLIKPAIATESFSFSDTRAGSIFNKLSSVYSVNIVYDQQQFSKCLITVSLDALSFEEKLDLLCKVLGVKYRIENATVYIDGKGCL